MNMKFYLVILVGFLISISIVGCGSSSSTPSSQTVGADIIQKYNFHIEGQPMTVTLTLPQQFTDANWGLKNGMCQQAGYDLTPFAGQDIALIGYNMTEKYSGESLSLIVLAKDQTCICSYVAASNLIPGIIAINDPNINIVTSTHSYDTLQYTLTSRGVIDIGKNVPITLTVKNSASGLFEVLVGAPEVTVQVFKGDSEVWDPYFGLAFPAIVHQISIPAGETKEYYFMWNQKDNTGNQVLSGSYTIKTSFIGNSEQVDISIR